MKVAATEILFLAGDLSREEAEEHLASLLKTGEIEWKEIVGSFEKTQSDMFQYTLLRALLRRRAVIRTPFLEQFFRNARGEKVQEYLLKITMGAPDRSLSAQELVEASSIISEERVRQYIRELLKDRMEEVRTIAGLDS